MNTEEIKKLDSQHVMQTYSRYDVAIESGKGATLYSPDGKEYIDFTAGIGVNSLGYGNKKWVDAIAAQAGKLQHISNLFYSEPYAKLAEILTKRTGMKSVFFANAGAEANEGMIKLARKYSFDKYGKGRSTIITLSRSFHGRTITTLSATGQEAFHNYFFPFTEGFKHVEPGDITTMQSELTPEVCAVMIELVQGEGGVLPLDLVYIKAIADFCEQKDILVLIDEVQTGVGRCGTLFAFQQYGITPDAVTFAKGIAGGLPMGGILANEKCSAVLTAGTHATTFGGNPVAAAGAIEVLSQLDDAELDKITKKGEFIRKSITSWGNPIVGELRGKGLMIGIPIKGDNTLVKAIATSCADKGLLVLTAGDDALRLLPPLLIDLDEINKGLAILKMILEVYKHA